MLDLQHHQRRAVLLSNEAVGELELYLAIWGSPDHRDSYGTYFDKAAPPDMALDFLPIPLMYEHGMAGNIKKEIIGSLNRIAFDDIGIKGFATLNRSSPFFSKMVEDTRARRLFTSSATAGHIADFDAEGRFRKWYLSELSLTESPAESKMPYVKLIRSNATSDGRLIISPENTNPQEPLQAGISVSGLTISKRGETMNALLQLLQSGGEVTPEALVTAAQQDGISLEQLLQVVQSVMTPGEAGDMMSSTLADTPAPGAIPGANPAAPPSPAPAGGEITPTVPGGVSPETMAQLAQLLMGRSGVAGGRAPAANTRAAMTAPPLNPIRGATQPRVNPTRRVEVASQYQHLSPDEMALGYILLEGAQPRGLRGHAPVASDEYMRAMAYKTAQEIERGKGAAVDYAVRSKFPFVNTSDVMRSDVGNAIRANEIMTGGSTQGAEWIYDLQGTTLWESIRNDTPIYQAMLAKGMDEAEIPQGFDSELIPLEGSDPSWYVAAGASDVDSSGTPVGTFNISKFGTGQKAVNVAKLSVAMDFRRELEEDSIINIVQEAQRKIRVSATEQMDYILLNGDTVLTANTNINLIDGTPAAAPARPSYTLLDGMVKLALSSANTSYDCDSTFDETDFLNIFKKLPSTHRQNRDRLMYVLDSDTGIAASNIASLKTRDVFSRATLEEGVLTSIWRIDVMETGFMYLANADGKISATPGNNTRGRIALVRPDQWASRWKRRMQTDVTYYPRQDVTEIVAHLRWGIAYRDAYAAAVGYNVNVALS